MITIVHPDSSGELKMHSFDFFQYKGIGKQKDFAGNKKLIEINRNFQRGLTLLIFGGL